MKFCSDCLRCYHGRTAPTASACECGNGCMCSCGCPANRARMERDATAIKAHQRAIYDAVTEAWNAAVDETLRSARARR